MSGVQTLSASAYHIHTCQVVCEPDVGDRSVSN